MTGINVVSFWDDAYFRGYVADPIDSTHFPHCVTICSGALNRTFSKQIGHSTRTAHWGPGGRGRV